jgi:hypothetical protein
MECLKDSNGRSYLQSTKKEREEDEIRMGLKGYYKVSTPICDGKYTSYYWEKKPGSKDNKKDSDLPF